MADRRGLGILGIGFGGITVAVFLIAAIVVQAHLTGQIAIETAQAPIVSAAVVR